MQKVGDFFATGEGKADPERHPEQISGSGGGGPVEAVWWNKDKGTQWRVRGRAYVVGPDIESEEGKKNSGVRTVKSEVGKRMRVLSGGGQAEGKEDGEGKEWSWERELTGHFGNCSPGMRGMFSNSLTFPHLSRLGRHSSLHVVQNVCQILDTAILKPVELTLTL